MKKFMQDARKLLVFLVTGAAVIVSTGLLNGVWHGRVVLIVNGVILVLGAGGIYAAKNTPQLSDEVNQRLTALENGLPEFADLATALKSPLADGIINALERYFGTGQLAVLQPGQFEPLKNVQEAQSSLTKVTDTPEVDSGPPTAPMPVVDEPGPVAGEDYPISGPVTQ